MIDHHQKDLVIFCAFTDLSVKMVKSYLGVLMCRILIVFG
ncbi:hypothetical protein AO370_0342 [Moraxella catarrhalis]|uniref:Uncharacterized protein n=1 Tax=Moraxella catarrhalis TaxID=480 RepID=A0AB36DQQ9_MORCA|nr:hypothetical protein AO379_0071 [Moraxella catarrhalis]OAV27151.1 hypothetical protein AO370_0342 [Moraxella catarrhalis]